MYVSQRIAPSLNTAAEHAFPDVSTASMCIFSLFDFYCALIAARTRKTNEKRRKKPLRVLRPLDDADVVTSGTIIEADMFEFLLILYAVKVEMAKLKPPLILAQQRERGAG